MNTTGPVAVDPNGNVWVANVPSGSGGTPYSITEITANAVSAGGCAASTCINYTGGGIFSPKGIATDSLGDAWVADGCSNSGCSGNGGVTEIKPGAAQDCSSGCAYFTITPDSGGSPQLLPEGVTVDGGGNVWFTNNGCVDVSNCPDNTGSVVEITAAAVKAGSCSGGCTLFYNANIADPVGVAVDSGGNAWVANSCGPADCLNFFGGSVTEIKSGATAGCASGCVNYTGGDVYQPAGVAIDSTGNVWVADPTLPGLSEIMSAATTAQACSAATCVNFSTGDNTGSLALDSDGDIWLARSTDSTILEIAPGASVDCSSGCTRITLPADVADLAVMND